MSDMDLKTRVEILPCGTCEDMMNCDDCFHQKEAKDIYQQIRADAIDELLERFIEMLIKGDVDVEDLRKLAEQVKEHNNGH